MCMMVSGFLLVRDDFCSNKSPNGANIRENDVNSLLIAFVSVHCAYNAQDSKNLSAKGDFVFCKREVVKR